MKPDLSAPGRYVIGPVSAGAGLAVERPDHVTSRPERVHAAERHVVLGADGGGSGGDAARPAPGLDARPGQGRPDGLRQHDPGRGARIARRRRAERRRRAGGHDPAESERRARPVPHHGRFDGAVSFDSAAWQAAAATDAAWGDAALGRRRLGRCSWSDAAWASAAWGDAAWSDAAWADAAWGDAAWADQASGDLSLNQASTNMTDDEITQIEADPRHRRPGLRPDSHQLYRHRNALTSEPTFRCGDGPRFSGALHVWKNPAVRASGMLRTGDAPGPGGSYSPAMALRPSGPTRAGHPAVPTPLAIAP